MFSVWHLRRPQGRCGAPLESERWRVDGWRNVYRSVCVKNRVIVSERFALLNKETAVKVSRQ